MTLAQMRHVLGLLRGLSEHFSASVLGLPLTSGLEATRIVTLACVLAVVDAVCRAGCHNSDCASVFSLHYAGEAAGPPSLLPFCFDVGLLFHAAPTLTCTSPPLLAALARALDYLHSTLHLTRHRASTSLMRARRARQVQEQRERKRLQQWERQQLRSPPEITATGSGSSGMGVSLEECESFAEEKLAGQLIFKFEQCSIEGVGGGKGMMMCEGDYKLVDQLALHHSLPLSAAFASSQHHANPTKPTRRKHPPMKAASIFSATGGADEDIAGTVHT